MGRRYGGLPALDFRSGGMYKPLLGCRNKSPQSFCCALPMGVFLCPAPPQRLLPSFSAGSGGQRGRQPQSTALLGTAVESPPSWGHTAAPACVGGWKLQPPAPSSCRAGGCGRMVPLWWHVGHGLQEACTHAPGEQGKESTLHSWSRTGSTHQSELKEYRQMSAAQGWHPRSCRSRHSFLILFQPQRGLKRALGSNTGPKHLDFAQPACSPPGKPAAIAPVPTSHWPRGGPFQAAALLPPAWSRRDEGLWCSRGARRGHG